jgi:hypothetical protein
MFLEVTIKPQHFPVVLQPWWLYSGNVIVLWTFSVLEEGQLGDALGQLVNKVLVDFLLHVLSLFLYTPVHKIKLLSLVETLFIRVTEHVTWKKWYLFGKVLLHTILFYL